MPLQIGVVFLYQEAILNVTWIGSPNHFNGRDGCRVTHITLHVMAGYLAGTDTVFGRSATQTSATYGIGGNGEIHQYVAESDGPWSDANYNSNLSTISIEHQGGLDFIPCTQACMDASAALCADISRRYGLGRLWHDGTRGNVWLHREIPGSDHATCPDLAPNGVNVDYIINKANRILNGNGDNNMTSAADVWNYGLGENATIGKNNQPAWVRLSWIHHDTALLVRMLTRRDDAGLKDGTNGDMYTRIVYMDKRIREMSATTAAQAAAIETLAKTVGTNPTDIGRIVADAVKNRLDELSITVTDKENK